MPMRKGKLWARLSLMFHIAFWVAALVWLDIAGEAGSPLPDNWQQLLFWAHIAEAAALFTLSASAACAFISRRRESKVPIAGVVSLLLLVLTAYFWASLLNNNNF
jgi:hypothetical protein